MYKSNSGDSMPQKIPEAWEIHEIARITWNHWCSGDLIRALLSTEALEGRLTRHWEEDKEFQDDMDKFFREYEIDKKRLSKLGKLTQDNLFTARRIFLKKRFVRIQILMSKKNLIPPDDVVYDESQ